MKTKLTILIGIITISVLNTSCCAISSHKQQVCDPNPSGFITDTTSKMLTKNYRDNLRNTSSQINTVTESQSVWFSYKEITEYLCVLQNEFTNQNNLKIEELGIRVYFGRYPDLENLDQSTFPDLIDVQNARTVVNNNPQQTVLTQDNTIVSYSNQHCVFFVPTYKKSIDGIKYYNQDFLINSPNQQPSKTLGNKILLLGKNKNHGGLAPPENVIGATYLQD